MRIDYKLEPDIGRVRRAYHVFGRRRILTVRVIGGFLFIGGLAVSCSGATAGSGIDSGYTGGFILGLGIVFFAAPSVGLWATILKARSLLQQTETVLDDEVIRTVSADTSVEIKWSAIDRIVVSDEFWFLCRRRRVLKVVPSAALTPAQRIQFREFLVRNRPGARRAEV